MKEMGDIILEENERKKYEEFQQATGCRRILNVYRKHNLKDVSRIICKIQAD